MKTPLSPLICGVAVVAMSAAGFSHWWSVHQFMAVLGSQPAAVVAPAVATPLPSALVAVDTPALPKEPATPDLQAATPDPHQRHFFEALVSRMESLQHQNRDLLDQLAETNRDLMKLQFRVDTHSESFRPLPLSEDQPFTSLDSEAGVLPPRAEPVLLPYQE
jgi:hypothetical protein